MNVIPRIHQPTLSVFSAENPFEFLGKVPVFDWVRTRLSDYHWVAQPPINERYAFTHDEVATTDSFGGVRLTVFLSDIMPAVEQYRRVDRLVLRRVLHKFRAETYHDNDRSQPCVGNGWSSVQISGHRYRIDAAHALLLDESGLTWQRIREGIGAHVFTMAGIELHVEIGAFLAAALSDATASTRGDLPATPVLYTKRAWLELGRTEASWSEHPAG